MSKTIKKRIQYIIENDIAIAVASFLLHLLMLSWVVMISSCHAVMRLPGYLSWNVPFDGAAVRPITEEISSYIHALPAL